MDRKEFQHLSKSELIGIICELMKEQESASLHDLTLKDVEAVRSGLDMKANRKKIAVRIASVLIVIAAIAVLISTLFLPVIQVTGQSMEPTLFENDVLLLVQSKHFDRGDVCCFSWQNKLLLKRVIGLPGDVIRMDKDGNVFVNDQLQDEPYLSAKKLGECDIKFPFYVPEGQYFVLGDHRESSVDSRSSVIGCVDQDQMVGREVFRLWPLRIRRAE